MGAVSDEDLTKIGVAIGNDRSIVKLAIRLGFSYADAKSCRNANRDKGGNVTCAGTQMILSNWKKVTDAEEQSTMLRKALEESGLKEIANILLPKKSKRKRESHAKKEPTDERGSKEGKVKKQKILAVDLAASTCNIKEDQHGAPAKKEEPRIAVAIKTEPQTAPLTEPQSVPTKAAPPDTAPQVAPVLKEDQPGVSSIKVWSCTTMGAISDEDLTKIGVAIGNDRKSVAKLAIRLGLSIADANRDEGENVTCAGTQLLLYWKKVTDAAEQSMKLRKALQESGLKEIANIFLPKYIKRKSKSSAKKEHTKARDSQEGTPQKQKILALDLSASTIKGDQRASARKEEPQIAVAIKAAPQTEPQSAPKCAPQVAPPKTVQQSAPTKTPQQTAPTTMAPQVAPVLKVPSIKQEQQTAPQATPAKATPKAPQKANKGAPSHGTKKKKEKGGVSLEAKQKELEKEEKALKKFERGVTKSRNAVSKLKTAIFKMEETKRIQLEKTLAETKAKLNKLVGTPK